jgi:two-component system, chemotaxis family, protein-glutamate methylesterase/glutaminase
VRVLVADDAVLFRRLLSDVLASLPGVEVVGTASNGKFALQKIRDLKPDLLTLDIEMPVMDGLAVLEALAQSGGMPAEVIVVSAQSRRGSQLTMRALEGGAFDFICKPEAASPEIAREALVQELAPRIRAVAHRLEVRTILRGKPLPVRTEFEPVGKVLEIPPQGASLEGIPRRMERLSNPAKPEMVLIGVSTGGPTALASLLPAIPKDIGVPILVVQHMPPIFTRSLAESLSMKCALAVREASHGEFPEPGTVYIAPGGRQMRLGVSADNRPVIELTDDPAENNCRPAVDYLFRSAALGFPGRTIAVILTGMGSDGTLGLRLLKQQSCFVIAQDEASCVIYGMPKAAVDAGVVDVVLPLDAIAGRVVAAVQGARH